MQFNKILELVSYLVQSAKANDFDSSSIRIQYGSLNQRIDAVQLEGYEILHHHPKIEK